MSPTTASSESRTPSESEARTPARRAAATTVARARTPAVPKRARAVASSPDEADPQQDDDRLEPVPPRDLLALRIRAAVVGDRQLVDAEVLPADLGRDLRL